MTDNKIKAMSPSESLGLRVVASENVYPHEETDPKRVAKLKGRIEDEALLRNPPLAAEWNGRFIVLDGATRTTALRELGFPHMVLQVVGEGEFELHSWRHTISGGDDVAELLGQLAALDGVDVRKVTDQSVICELRDLNGNIVYVCLVDGANKAQVTNDIVNTYTAWGTVERTAFEDVGKLLGQFPNLTAVAVFPPFDPKEVFTAVEDGNFLPAGITRFVVPGRILKLNVLLDDMRREGTLGEKREWFDEFLAERLETSSPRLYAEPVMLLDE